MKDSSLPLKADRKLADIYGEDFPLLGLIRDVGRRLRAMREDQGIQQRALAETIGTTQMQVYNVEHGKKLGMSLRAIVQHAEALGFRTVITFEPDL